MEKKEKVEFILEQMRLCLARKDFVRTQIISKKINTKYFEEVETHVSYLAIVSVVVQYFTCEQIWQFASPCLILYDSA